MRWTIPAIAAVVIPAIAAAQQPTYGRDTARARGRDTARTEQQRVPRDKARRDQVRAESRGAVDVPRRGARRRTTWGLSTTQISDLQQSLQRIDCYDGEIDGLIGPKTRAGIACAMRHHNITGEDPNELMQALGLDFQVNAKAGLGAVMRSGAQRGQGEMRGRQPGMARPEMARPDTARRDTTRDTLQNQQQPPPTPPR
jgi:hypothetical protein